MELTADNLKTFHEIVARYPEKRSAVMPLLYLAMAEDGHLTNEGMEEVAEWTGITPAQVQSVASFYTMFRLSPKGETIIEVCTTLSCALGGAEDILLVEHGVEARRGAA